MHKKDFQTFARMIRTQKHRANILTPEESKNEDAIVTARIVQIGVFMYELCEIFKADNPNFDEKKFIKACTIDTESK